MLDLAEQGIQELFLKQTQALSSAWLLWFALALVGLGWIC
jgi:hypothetical protein